MYSRDAHPSYVSVINLRSIYFRFKLGGSSAPTIQYGSNWIANVYGPGASVPTTGNYGSTVLATNQVAVIAKDNFFDVIDADTAWRDNGGTGQYASIGYGSTAGGASNEGSTAPMVFVLNFFNPNGSAVANPTGTVGGFLEINNGNVTTPGGN